jgi:ribosomal protein S18 acetylase RimI-like enzyme
MEILSLEQKSLNKLKPLIQKCRFIPYVEYGVRKDLLVDYIISDLQDTISKNGCVLIAKENNDITGFISAERSNWDSNHFGIEIAKIDYLMSSSEEESFNTKKTLVKEILKEYQVEKVYNISARIYKEDLSSIHALESNNYRLMDVLVTYFFDFRQKVCTPHGFQHHVRQYDPKDIPQLAQIARECFGKNSIATDRFHADHTLSREKSDDLYIKWLTDSLKEPDGTIIVAENDGKPIGFNICKIHKLLEEKIDLRLGTIDLTAVEPSARGKSVATSLLNASLKWFSDKVDIVESGGQVSNYAIQRAWNRLGFKIVRSQCTFHWAKQFESQP